MAASKEEGRRIAIIGGGAAGFFAALSAAEADPQATIDIFEQSKHILRKVKISGGGRCNVTHHCFDPKDLVRHYPRGQRELRSVFHRWQPADTLDWFADQGVELKTEDDGRMFPTSDDSQTIIDCFTEAARRHGIRVHRERGLDGLSTLATEPSRFRLDLSDGSHHLADRVLIAAGSLKASRLSNMLEALGHHIEPLAPSLFAFNLADKRTHGLAGLSVPQAEVWLDGAPERSQTGPLLITHRGLSGPAVLRLSAWEARELQARNYHFDICVNWLGQLSKAGIEASLERQRKQKSQCATKPFESLPRRLWERLLTAAGISPQTKWAQLPRVAQTALVRELTEDRYHVQGKTTNKDEFVTCGGIRLSEVDFKTMQSRLLPGVHFAGESLDLDGITGGFNFQAAWSTGRIAGRAMAGHPL